MRRRRVVCDVLGALPGKCAKGVVHASGTASHIQANSLMGPGNAQKKRNRIDILMAS